MSIVHSYNSEEYFRILHEAAPYIKQHRGKLFVIYISADVCKSDNFRGICRELKVVSKFGSKILIIHGLKRRFKSKLTDAGCLRAQKESALIKLNFEQMLNDGYFFINGSRIVSFRPMGVVDGVHYPNRGEFSKVDTKELSSTLRKKIGILSPVDHSMAKTYLIDPYELAINLSATMQADKLIVYSDEKNFFSHSKSFQLTADEADGWIKSRKSNSKRFRGLIRGALRTKLPRIHLVHSQSQYGLIRELYSTHGSGVLIRRAVHNKIRIAKTQDINAIHWLLNNPKSQSSFLLRTHNYLTKNISNFLVADLDNEVVGTCESKTRSSSKVAEIGGVCVHNDYQNRGIMNMLINRAEQELTKKGIKKIFVLTTKNEMYFSKLGYQKTSAKSLPSYRLASYHRSKRNSVIMCKELA